jgi:hypothetical protein
MTTRSNLTKSALVTVAVLTLGMATPAGAASRGVTVHTKADTHTKAHAMRGPVKIIPRKPPIKGGGGPYDPPPNHGSDGGAGTGGGGPNTWMCDDNGNCGAYRSS